jgi:hypothetical protein
MCQGSCSTNTCQQTCSPAEAQLRKTLADIQKLAEQQLQALQALRGPDDKPQPAAFALRLIATRAEAALEAAPAPATGVTQPVTVHRPGQLGRDFTSKCGCRSTTECNCMAMDLTASLLYRSHEQHRRTA